MSKEDYSSKQETTSADFSVATENAIPSTRKVTRVFLAELLFVYNIDKVVSYHLTFTSLSMSDGGTYTEIVSTNISGEVALVVRISKKVDSQQELQ